ncbi:MAG: LemA family protein [Candidatus Cryptobacteroides sp.]|nr:LemA family protein [Bacteroidales bacterium]MDY5744163.1 LemA family protein [Candidatus Cryptobacteroides sp.]
MKKTTWIILGVAALLILALVGAYIGMVSGRENARKAWSDVETQYQRRSDLIPNLVSTVKGYADYEAGTLEDVISARSKATAVNVNMEDLSEEAIAKFQEAQGELSGALGRLLAITENYPDLKANENFVALQDELAGTENRIANARRSYNEVANDYNIMIQKFPKNIIANIFSFKTMGLFKADEGAENAPKVEF